MARTRNGWRTAPRQNIRRILEFRPPRANDFGASNTLTSYRMVYAGRTSAGRFSAVSSVAGGRVRKHMESGRWPAKNPAKRSGLPGDQAVSDGTREWESTQIDSSFWIATAS